MKKVCVRNRTKGTVVCAKCEVADNILTRVRGLMWRAHLAAEEGLWIKPCPSIHMFNMKFAIDAVFLTRDGIVTDMVKNIQPGKTYVAKKNAGKAYSTVEVTPGTLEHTSTEIGDTLVFEPV